ncbi:hypothetical protein [Congregibacter litoralis]|uniref:Transglutaminase-like domain-containing protein n=1 Tax=Congregibacter litoralis KT71 TaxID=314285 RepID=A4A543_9GAMM|nr:hypothetical protein [Congregibacter litoralis]EAQ98914.2 hypothetical protein KT71_09812 [Congregibacter litoralis KT71]
MRQTTTLTVRLAASAGLVLLSLNFFGLTQNLRPEGLTPDVLRFGERDLLLSQNELEEEIVRGEQETDAEFLNRVTHSIADGMAHIHWERFDANRFHQQVPVWENYILWGMRYITKIPEYERYHFSNVEKSIERGIGICGDASILLSQILTTEGISNQIVSMPDHVIVVARLGDQEFLLDADFGVVAAISLNEAMLHPARLIAAYAAEDKYDSTVSEFTQALTHTNQRWDGPQAFITKKYYFEKLAYFLKWTIPALLLLVALFLFRNKGGV